MLLLYTDKRHAEGLYTDAHTGADGLKHGSHWVYTDDNNIVWHDEQSGWLADSSVLVDVIGMSSTARGSSSVVMVVSALL